MACRHHVLLNIDAVPKQPSNGAAVAIRVDPSDDDRLAFHQRVEVIAGCIGIRVVVRVGLHRCRTKSRHLLPLRSINTGEPDAFACGGLAGIAFIAAADRDLVSRCRCCFEAKGQNNAKRARDG